MKSFRFISALCASMLLTSCAMLEKPELFTTDAAVDAPSELMISIQNSAKPRFAMPVGVYAFRDQTGQYKPQENVSSFSTAVTQGATAMLTQVLLETGWFAPLEREGLQNLLTERKIV